MLEKFKRIFNKTEAVHLYEPEAEEFFELPLNLDFISESETDDSSKQNISFIGSLANRGTIIKYFTSNDNILNEDLYMITGCNVSGNFRNLDDIVCVYARKLNNEGQMSQRLRRIEPKIEVIKVAQISYLVPEYGAYFDQLGSDM